MKNKLILMVMMFMAAWAFSSCGGGSSAGGGSEGGGSDGAGEATVASLSSIPTIDLSQYDSSSSSSANLVSLLSQSAELSKGLGENARAVGGASRAGCEANMHKQEVFRMSQAVQLDRCYPEAMEKVGLITIPVGSYAFYRITPPEMNETQEGNMCDDIPTEREDERTACEGGSDGPRGKTILMRLGRIDNALHVDMCQESALANEATYGASGSVYTGSVVRIGSWGGHTERSSFDVTVDIGTTGSVADSIATIGSDGLVSATGHMDGGFGSGSIAFEYVASDASNKVRGAFAGAFDDPFSGTRSEFTGRVYSHFGGAGATGCAKFSFTGTMPAMRVQDMVPFDIPTDQLNAFLQSFGAELGITLNSSNYTTISLCPNPDFDPESPDPTIKPMLVMTGSACGTVTHTGVECFGITNGTTTTDFGTEVTQAFVKIANSGSRYYDEVNAFDLSTLSPAISAIAFARNWDCSGTFTDVAFQNVDPQTMMTAMSECFALEEKARGNNGMGDYACGREEQMNGVNDFKDEGGGATSFGKWGGSYQVSTGACTSPPDNIFVNMIDGNRYCIPADGRCAELTLAEAGGSATIAGGAIEIEDGWTITALSVTGDGEMNAATVTFTPPAGGSCIHGYSGGPPSFEKPGEFGGEGGGGVPQACIDAGFDAPEEGEACGQLCMRERSCGPQ